MFLPFSQSGDDRSGLGLGLDIARRSVEANCGVLTVRDVPGTGCVFTIDLPRLAETKTEPLSAPETQPSAAAERSVS
jgi:signal transduction histidine kinase